MTEDYRDAATSDLALAHDIALAVAQRGGRVYYVGGCVRDQLLGRPSKDVDIEVHGLAVEDLRQLLAAFGEVDAIGASFGILSIRGHTLDIAVPRRSDAGSRGTRDDFARLTDPFVGTYEAARRRDLTMNALYQDVLSGEVIDHFGGQADLERGVVRHVDPETFAEDPLRVLRVAQFAARFGMEVDPATTELCASLSLADLPAERVLEELHKALVKADQPSRFFVELRKMGQLSPWFGEIEALIGVPQNPVYHPEGDVWNHTMLVLDHAAQLRAQASDAFCFTMAALCHDVGKALTTCECDGRIISYGHETEGLEPTGRLLGRLRASSKLTSYVLNMVELHMAPNAYVAQGAKQKAYNKLFDRSCSPRDLLLLARCDSAGRAHAPSDDQAEEELESRLQTFEAIMARPYVQGRDLLAEGVEPGPLMGEALKHAHKLRLAGMSKESALRQTLGYLREISRHPRGTSTREGEGSSEPSA